MHGFCEFDVKSIDIEGKILYNIIVECRPENQLASGGFDANQNKEKPS